MKKISKVCLLACLFMLIISCSHEIDSTIGIKTTGTSSEIVIPDWIVGTWVNVDSDEGVHFTRDNMFFCDGTGADGGNLQDSLIDGSIKDFNSEWTSISYSMSYVFVKATSETLWTAFFEKKSESTILSTETRSDSDVYDNPDPMLYTLKE